MISPRAKLGSEFFMERSGNSSELKARGPPITL